MDKNLSLSQKYIYINKYISIYIWCVIMNRNQSIQEYKFAKYVRFIKDMATG